MTGRWEGKRDGSHKFMWTSKTHGFGEIEEPEAGGAPTAAAAAAAAAGTGGTGVCARGGPGVIDAPVTTAEPGAGAPSAAAAGGIGGGEGEDVVETTATLDDDLSGTDDGEGRGGKWRSGES